MGWVLGCLLLFRSDPVWAQQEPIYSQYMFNGLVLNPAYTGSRDQLSMTFIGRRQWVGMEGAPATESFGIHAPFSNKRGGIGLTAVHDKIGFQEEVDVNMTYAFRIPLGPKHNLAMGILGGVKYHELAFSQISTRDPGDPAFNGQDVYLWKPNFGAGIYYHSEWAYLGFSSPNLLANRQSRQLPDESREGVGTNHYYATGGLVVKLTEGIKVKPSLLMRAVRGAPVGWDFNLGFLFADRVWAGASYRVQDAWVLMAEFQLTQQLRIGYSYDRTFSPLATYGSGSHELRLGIDLKVDKNRVESPRLFYF